MQYLRKELATIEVAIIGTFFRANCDTNNDRAEKTCELEKIISQIVIGVELSCLVEWHCYTLNSSGLLSI